MALNDAQVKALDASIPREQIHTKPGKGGLSYVAGGWVVDQMNRIFGPDGWSMAVLDLSPVPGAPQQVGMIARVRVTLHERGEPGRTICSREDVAAGTGHGADAWHQAAGEAVTDATKRCCARLGRYLGGQLYLKPSDDRSRPEAPIDVVQHGKGRGKPLRKAPTEWLRGYVEKYRSEMSSEHLEWCECELARRETEGGDE